MSYITQEQAKRVAKELLDQEGEQIVELLIERAMGVRSWFGVALVLEAKWERLDQELFGEDVA